MTALGKLTGAPLAPSTARRPRIVSAVGLPALANLVTWSRETGALAGALMGATLAGTALLGRTGAGLAPSVFCGLGAGVEATEADRAGAADNGTSEAAGSERSELKSCALPPAEPPSGTSVTLPAWGVTKGAWTPWGTVATGVGSLLTVLTGLGAGNAAGPDVLARWLSTRAAAAAATTNRATRMGMR